MKQNIIEINDLTIEFNNKKIYDNLNLYIKESSFISIIGPTGSGKSLLAKIIMGKVNDTGAIKISKENRGDFLCLSDDCSNLLICKTVIENLHFSLRMSKEIYKEEDLSKIINDYDIKKLINRDIKTLSTSEKQLIGLICVLIIKPRVLIIDEILSNIANDKKEKILMEFKKLNKKGMTIINFTQDSELLLEGSHIALLNHGKILLYEEVKNAFNDDKIYIDNNIELPFVIEMSIKLKYYDVVDKIYFNIKELVNDLWK